MYSQFNALAIQKCYRRPAKIPGRQPYAIYVWLTQLILLPAEHSLQGM